MADNEKTGAPVNKLPTGTVTFVFTDIEGSTNLAQQDPDQYRGVIEEQARTIRRAISKHGGTEVSSEGDSFFLVFTGPRDAVTAVVEWQRELAQLAQPIRVRVGIHTGEGILGGSNYLGLDVNRTARIAAAGHGGQVLLSQTTAALVSQQLGSELTIRPLGAHRLKDFNQPEAISQLVIPGLEDSFPPLRTARAGNLPAPLNSFVERPELEEVATILDRARLVTLTGPGGSGKTRLGIEIGRRLLNRYRDGVWFVPLAPVTDPNLIASATVAALGVAIGVDEPQDRLLEYLRDRQLLLILDNFEQLVGGASLVAEWLSRSDGVSVLVTSRGPLRITGEEEVPVPPLDDVEATELFLARARAARPNLELTEADQQVVIEIVRRVDRLPLAIELAASRTRILSLESIAERLNSRLGLLTGGSRDAPERHRTLRATIAWSYDLLPAETKEVFAQLAVFAGSFDVEQAEAIVESADLLEGLSDLVDQGLLRPSTRPGRARFLLLETIKEFALEQLDQRGLEDQLRQRHAAAYLALAKKAQPGLTRRQSRHWLDLVEADHDNARAALAYATANGRGELAQELAAALWRFWQMRGYLAEGRVRVGEALTTPGGTELSRMRAEEAAGGLAYWQADSDAAVDAYERALELARAVGSPAELTTALTNLGMLRGVNSRTEEALALHAEAEEVALTTNDLILLGKVRWARGSVLFLQGVAGLGRPEEALVEFIAAGELFEGSDFTFDIGWTRRMIGIVRISLGMIEEGEAEIRTALEHFISVGDLSALPLLISDFARIAVASGNWEEALLLSGAIAKLQSVSETRLVDWVVNRIDQIDEARQRLGPELVDQLVAEGHQLTVEEVLSRVRSSNFRGTSTTDTVT